jgi:hypothetical protein
MVWRQAQAAWWHAVLTKIPRLIGIAHHKKINESKLRAPTYKEQNGDIAPIFPGLRAPTMSSFFFSTLNLAPPLPRISRCSPV